jgi:hypothetical protein
MDARRLEARRMGSSVILKTVKMAKTARTVKRPDLTALPALTDFS